MSTKTDERESDVAAQINRTTSEVYASRPKASTSYSDVWLTKEGCDPCWLEVKLEHGANLLNPRVFYCDGRWQTTYKSYSARATIDLLNGCRETKQFIQSLCRYTDIPPEQLKIPTTQNQFKGMLGRVSSAELKEFFTLNGGNQYIANVAAFDIGSLLMLEYNEKGVHYVQIEDDFYRIGYLNPLKLREDIPILEGIGDFKVRISTRPSKVEVHPEVKLWDMPKSDFSCMPDTEKTSPFSI